MSTRNTLLEGEDNWVTAQGAWFPGERVVFKGKDLFTEMFEMPWMAVWHHSVLDRPLPEDDVELWNRMWVLATSYPEPRIWNNRVAALTGSARSSAYLAMAAATASSEATYFGGKAIIAAADFIQTLKIQVCDQGECLEEVMANWLREHGVPAGFGRPVIRSDERIPPALKLAKSLNLDGGAHLRLALEVERLLSDMGYKAPLNIGGLTSALASDQGMSAREFYCTSSVVYLAGMMACYCDAIAKPAGSFFPLRCDRINYRGVQSRKWEKPQNLLD